MPVLILSSETDATQSADLAEALRRAGRDVTLDARGPVPLHAISAVGHELVDMWRSAPPDAVLASGWQAGLAAQMAVQGRAIPVLQRFSGLATRGSDPKRARLESALARGADRVVASHAGQVEHLVALGVRRPAIRVVPYGVDVTIFSERGSSWPRSGRRRLVTAVTSADPAFVAALVNALPAIPDAELMVIGLAGAEPAGDGVLQQALRRGVADRVKLTGSLTLEEKATLLRSCDLAISTTAEDAAAAFVLQAMACGVPVVARAVGSAADAVADGVTGVLVPPGGPHLLADAVRGLLGDTVRRESFGLAAVDRARARFNWSVAASAIGRVLDEFSAAEEHVVTLPRQDAVGTATSALFRG
jgi:glycosyltransferase involved in cell wall biosynthesis